MENSSRMQNDRCFLLELPRETRDMIYRFALAHDDGLQVSIDTRKSRMLVYGRSSYAYIPRLDCANPLKLVCHQLYHETKSAIFTANSSVSLYCLNSTVPGSSVLNIFAKRIGNVAVARLQKVAVSGSHNVTTVPLTWFESPRRMTRFKDFCAAHPKITVVIRLAHVEYIEGATWLYSCLALKSLIRGPLSIPPTVDLHDYRVQLAFFRFRNLVDGLENLPANLRFSMLNEVPQVEMLMRMMTDSPWVQDVIPFAREMWEDGI
jgi:hypothetical protein